MFQEGFTFSNFSTAQKFTLTLGGRYMLSAKATWGGGNLKLQMLGPDGSTYVDIFGAYDVSAAQQNEPINTLLADGAILADLPPGSYQLAPTTASAIYANIARIPLA